MYGAWVRGDVRSPDRLGTLAAELRGALLSNPQRRTAESHGTTAAEGQARLSCELCRAKAAPPGDAFSTRQARAWRRAAQGCTHRLSWCPPRAVLSLHLPAPIAATSGGGAARRGEAKEASSAAALQLAPRGGSVARGVHLGGPCRPRKPAE